jgi:predicted TIM-barrel fold metal-dependent hydrolase
VIFTTDMPFGDPAVELARVVEAPLPDTSREAILGGTLAGLLGR